MSDPATAALSKARVAAVPSPLEGQGGGDRKTSAVGSPPTPNPSHVMAKPGSAWTWAGDRLGVCGWSSKG